MKRNISFGLFLAVIVMAFIACNTRSMITPVFQTSNTLIRTYTVQDSLGRDSIVTDTVTFTDSLNVGDTVRMGLMCNGFYDYLKTVKVSGDTSKVKTSLEWPDSLSYVLASDADPAHGVLTFLPEKAYAIYTTVTYIPVASGTHKVDIGLLSAAPESYNQTAGYFFIAVK